MTRRSLHPLGVALMLTVVAEGCGGPPIRSRPPIDGGAGGANGAAGGAAGRDASIAAGSGGADAGIAGTGGGTAGSGSGGGLGSGGTTGAGGGAGTRGSGGTTGAGGGAGARGSGGTTGAGGGAGAGGAAGNTGAGGRTGTGGIVAGTGGAGGRGTGGGTSTGGATGAGGVAPTGGSTGTGGAPGGTGGIAGGTGGGAGGLGGSPPVDAGTGGAAVDPCGDSCGPGTFCNEARATCLPAGLEWVPIHGGTFTMGNDTVRSALSDTEWAPAHQVTVPDFEMLRSEVTVAQYRVCVDAGACTIPNSLGDSRATYNRPGSEHHPVNEVSALQAAAYCAFVAGRLPSEAEWEYADSNGVQGRYSWSYGGNTDGFDCNHAVIGSTGCGRNSTWQVCSKPLGNTSHGLCDMTGNVAEWVADDFIDYGSDQDRIIDTPVDGSAYRSPTHTDTTTVVKRGSSYIQNVIIGSIIILDPMTSFYRGWDQGTYWTYVLGFRCARAPTSASRSRP